MTRKALVQVLFGIYLDADKCKVVLAKEAELWEEESAWN